MNATIRTLALASALAIIGPAMAGAVAISPDGAWNEFDVDTNYPPEFTTKWIDLDGNLLTFTVTLTQAAILDVTDGAFGGDTFTIFDNGLLLGMSSPGVNTYPDSLTLDFDAAFADPRYSHASFRLEAGVHEISGELAESALVDGEPINATVGALRLTPVDAPATLPILAVGLVALGLLRRRSQAART